MTTDNTYQCICVIKLFQFHKLKIEKDYYNKITVFYCVQGLSFIRYLNFGLITANQNTPYLNERFVYSQK